MPLRLVFRNLTNHWVRTLLTIGSLTVAVFLLCFLRSVLISIDSAVVSSASNRLISQSAVSLFVTLPLSYQGKIDQVSGVAGTTKMNWFGGYYQTQENFFAQFAVDADRLLPNYPEIEIVEGSIEAFVQNRTACLIGTNLRDNYGWKVGDRVPIISALYPRMPEGAWEFDVAAVYHSNRDNIDNNTLFFDFDYLYEAIEADQADGPEGVGVLAVGLRDPGDAEKVSAAIDQLFENGPQRVQTTTEAEFQRQFVGMFGNVPLFLSALGMGVIFAIVLAVLNTMLMAARERVHSVGVMKALGFVDRKVAALLVLESLTICLIGTTVGILLAMLSEKGLRASPMGVFFPGYRISGGTVVLCLIGAVVVGLIAAAIPASQIQRLRPVDALRSEG